MTTYGTYATVPSLSIIIGYFPVTNIKTFVHDLQNRFWKKRTLISILMDLYAWCEGHPRLQFLIHIRYRIGPFQYSSYTDLHFVSNIQCVHYINWIFFSSGIRYTIYIYLFSSFSHCSLLQFQLIQSTSYFHFPISDISFIWTRNSKW